MRWALLLSGILEILGATACYFMPQFIYTGGPDYLIKLHGLSALVLGIISLVLYAHFSKERIVKLIYLALMFFHGAVAMMTYGSVSEAIPYPLGATLTHLAVFIIFFIGYMKDLTPDQKA